MGVHYTYGGSTAARTINCPAWVGLSKQIPPSPSSDAAMTGTMLHTVGEKMVLDDLYDPEIDVGQVIDDVELTRDHVIQKLYPALDAVAELEDDYEVEFETEVLMEMSEDTGGTADLIGLNAGTNTFVMADFKFGDGYLVYPTDNQQLLFYTMLAVSHYDFDFNTNTRIIMAIIQPSERKEQVLEVWETDFQTVQKFIKTFNDRYKVAKNRKSQPAAGSHCSYCPAEAVCPAKTGAAQKALRLPAKSMELEQLNEAMQIVNQVESWVKAVRKMAHEQAEEGVNIAGFKLVQKRAMRVWYEPTAISHKVKMMKKLRAEDYMEMKLMSPAKLEKVCKAKDVDFKQFSSYISSVSHGTTLVADSDKRPAIVPVKGLAALAAGIKG